MSILFPLSTSERDAFIRATLAEDMGAGGDITSNAVIPADARFHAIMATREPIVVAGIELAAAFMKSLAPAEIDVKVKDGDAVPTGSVLLEAIGNGRALLTSERSALNTLQHLSGIATLTRKYVDAIEGTGAILLDTRKTTPGLRLLEKYATRMGRAENHRLRLDDGVMIKDNHIAIAGGIAKAVQAARGAGLTLPVQIECDSLSQVQEALNVGADRLLLDNMTTDQLREAVEMVAGRIPTEASGGVRLDTIRAIAESGVTYVSVGRITQSAPAVDIGLDFRAL